MKQPKKDIVWHNPENADISTIPKGWRLLVEGEKIPIGNCLWELWVCGEWTESGSKIGRDAGQDRNTTYIVGYPLPDSHMEEANEWRPIEEWKEGPAWVLNGGIVCGAYASPIQLGPHITHFLLAEFPAPPIIEKTQEAKDVEEFERLFVDKETGLTNGFTWQRDIWNAALAYARK